MCGIVGIVDLKNRSVAETDIRGMMARIKHRGPDGEGVYIGPNLGLGHVRLSIIDLSEAGHQPMHSADGQHLVVFNGEIYNYLELKAQLESSYSFKTKSDTEVVLAAYLTWGKDCLNKFNGDFAFVIHDLSTGDVFGARDRYGIKPFYYTLQEDRFIFGSEIKAILPLLKKKEANQNAIFEYLIFNRTDQGTHTFFNGVEKLRHGHCFTIKNGQYKSEQWYNIWDKIGSTNMSGEQYREAYKDSIRLRLRSDVKVGVSLSGGIDSSATACSLIHDFGLSNIDSFSAVYGKHEESDESIYIDEFKDLLSNQHFVTPSGETLFKDLDDFIYSHTEPVSAIGPYAQFKVFELAQKHVTVTLDGQGADEQLGGYHNFFGAYFKELLTSMKLLKFASETSSYYSKHGIGDGYKFLAYYLMPMSIKKKASTKIYGSISQDFFNQYSSSSDIHEKLYSPKSLNDSLVQHFEYKLEHLLKWEDHNGMWFSIEPRVPFLDHNLVEKTLALPPDRIIKDGMTKHILREAMTDVLPPMIRDRRDKKGFSTPADKWFRQPDFQDYVMELLTSSSFKSRGCFNQDDCIKRYESHIAGKANIAKDIWKWIVIEAWFRKFIDN
ncbi:MAG: asparagine synthase (glutamine-hydrolyzing) [Granulosicoccus sp.]|jgi:asparagine synthase (glutamine-hydrolysing)